MQGDRSRRLETHECRHDAIDLMYVGRLVARTSVRVMLSSTWSADLETQDPYLRSIVDSLCGQRALAPIADVT